jgi:hypothetical protein
LLIASAIGCGGHSSATDANGDDGAGGDDAPGGGGTVMLTLTNRPTNAAMFTFLVAFQDGSDPWKLAPAPTGDTYALPVSSAAYAVAYSCVANLPSAAGPPRQNRELVSAAFTVAERTSLTFDIPPRCTDRITNVGVSGTVSNRGNGGGAFQVAFGDKTANVNANTGAFAFETPPGTHDLLVLHVAPGGGIGGDVIVDRVAVQRGLGVTAATTANVDFSTSQATQSFTDTITVPGLARVSDDTVLYSAGDTNPSLVSDGTSPFTSGSLAAVQMTSGDLYDQQITVSGNGQTAITTIASATPAAQTYVAPAPLGGAIATVAAATPYPQVATMWSSYTNAIGYGWAATQQLAAAQCNNNLCTTTWTAAISPGVAGASPKFQMPDLSALAGWSANLQFATGTMVTGTVQAMTSSAGAGDFPAGKPTAGTTRTFVRSGWTVTP